MVKIQRKKGNRLKLHPAAIYGVLAALAIATLVISSDERSSSIGALLEIDANTAGVGSIKQERKSLLNSKAVFDSGLPETFDGSQPSDSRAMHGFVPVRCEELFQNGYLQPEAATAKDPSLNPNNDKLFARYTRSMDQKFWVAVHQESFDTGPWSEIYLPGFYNKTALNDAVIQSIQQTPGRVLDVGGQVGWFSLLARSMGMEVDVFDPVPANAFRICESLFLNKWSNAVERSHPGPYVNIYNYAVLDGSKTGFISLKQKGASVGFLRDGESITVPMTSLDEFVADRRWGTTKISVLKINVDGMESQVIAGASNLLQSKTVQNVLMPLPNVGALGDILKFGYRLWKWGIEIGPDQEASKLSSSTTDASELYKELSGKGGGEVYLWFRLRPWNG